VRTRAGDGSAGDADYGAIAAGYTDHRRPEPHIARLIEAALGQARTVVNVGAGSGSYEPTDREVTAVEPSSSMRSLRAAHLPAAIDAVAERLPFVDRAFDAAMATFSVHQWADVSAGLSEMRRVSRGAVVILTCDPARVRDFWLYEYAPEVLDVEAGRYPSISTIAQGLGGRTTVITVPIPADCRDGFNEAYYSRPERLLDPAARKACSSWSFVAEPAKQRFADHLKHDLDSGDWDKRHGHLRSEPNFRGSLVLVVGEHGPPPRRT
jgi:SAM-dependent methyltransferase